MTAKGNKAATALVDQSGSFERSQSKIELRRLKAPVELTQIRLQSRLLALLKQQSEFTAALDTVAKASDEVLRAANLADVAN